MNAEHPRDLRERTLNYASAVIGAYAEIPRDQVAFVLGKQLLRSGTSVGAHYREACRAKSDADIVSKMEGAIQELDESDYWLELLQRHRLLTQDTVEKIQRETNELIAIFVSIVTKIKNRGKR